jgi:hypothetical protein
MRMTKTTKQPWPLWFLFIAGAAVILLQATCADFAIAQGVPRGTVTTQMMESYPIRGFSSVDCSAEACNATGDLGQQCTDPAGLWLCDGAGAFVLLVTGGSGDVVGPASSIDNAIARYDGTTGKLIQGYTSGAPTIDDTGGMTLAGNVTLSMGGATVDGKDISGQGAFKNESNAFLEDQSVASGKKIGYEGAAGDTYTLRDIDRAALETTVDGTIATRTEADNWRPPPCPANLNDVPFGGICTEAATGKIRFRGTLEAIP